jgi:1,4-alpha-glucan branching enzyme
MSKMKKSDSNKKKNVEFSVQAEPGKNIFLAGTFNNWNPIRMKQKKKEDDLYTITLHLPPGSHEYKFVVDDVWQIDPKNPETVQNDFGSMNSVVTL